MRRRDFLAVLGGLTALLPQNANAQQVGKTYRIGVFTTANNPAMRSAYRAFLKELGAQGFIEGQNLTIHQHSTNRTPAALASNVAEMARSGVDVIVTGTQPPLQAAVGTGIPFIISANNYDPIARGYVKSLSRPGGNVTGVVLQQTELAEKQVELLTQAFPDRKKWQFYGIKYRVINSVRRTAAQKRSVSKTSQ